MDDKITYQAQLFSNRLDKRFKHLKKWAKRTNVECMRIYDKDIPEIPLAVDYYQSADGRSQYVQIAFYERPYEKDEQEEIIWLDTMAAAASGVLGVSIDNVVLKVRRRQRGSGQYTKNEDDLDTAVPKSITVREQGHLFSVNLATYLDTGLFFDHRPLRQKIRSEAAGKRVLNLFCYTGSFSVYAAGGRAACVDSVDMSPTYLSWAVKNMSLNGFTDCAVIKNRTAAEDGISSWVVPAVETELTKKVKYRFYQCDCREFLLQNVEQSKTFWDIIVLDPPTFSNSKKMRGTLDINRDWLELASLCIKLLSPNGVLYFSTNSRRLSLDDKELSALVPEYTLYIDDITEWSIPEDFRSKKIHKAWKIQAEKHILY